MPDEINGVILQAFHWFQDPDDAIHGGVPLWVFLKERAGELRALGIDAVWIPPAYKGAGGRGDVGYGVYDHYDLGEFDAQNTVPTKYGSKDDLLDAVRALHARNIQVYADVVLNHKMGGELERYAWDAVRVEPDNRNRERWEPGFESGMIGVRSWTNFNHPERNDTYSAFKWRARHFDGVDSAFEVHQNGQVFHDARDGRGNPRFIYRFIYNEEGYAPQVKPGFESWVDHEKGNFDYLTGADLDYGRHDVREEMKRWGHWLVETVGLDGFRLDAVKHISADYLREWLGHVRAQAPGKQLLAIGEYLSSDVAPLHDFLSRVSAAGEFPQEVSLLDVPLRFKIGAAGWQGDAFDLRAWNRQTLMA